MYKHLYANEVKVKQWVLKQIKENILTDVPENEIIDCFKLISSKIDQYFFIQRNHCQRMISSSITHFKVTSKTKWKIYNTLSLAYQYPKLLRWLANHDQKEFYKCPKCDDIFQFFCLYGERSAMSDDIGAAVAIYDAQVQFKDEYQKALEQAATEAIRSGIINLDTDKLNQRAKSILEGEKISKENNGVAIDTEQGKTKKHDSDVIPIKGAEKWEDVHFQMVKRDIVKIFVKGEAVDHRDHKQLGMFDGRKMGKNTDNELNRDWNILLYFCVHPNKTVTMDELEKILFPENRQNTEDNTNIKIAISNFRKKLYDIFPDLKNENPIYYDRNKNDPGYKTRFMCSCSQELYEEYVADFQNMQDRINREDYSLDENRF